MSHKVTELRTVNLRITEEEADALLCILLNAPPSSEVSEGMAEALLCRVADAQRCLDRLTVEKVRSRSRRRVLRRRRVVSG